MILTNIIISLLVLFLVGSGWWLFFRKKKKKSDPFPAPWRTILVQEVRFYQALSKPEKDRFEQSIQQFFADVTITGIETTVDETDRLLIAASAVIPLFGFPGWRYRNLNEVLLYGGNFDEE